MMLRRIGIGSLFTLLAIGCVPPVVVKKDVATADSVVVAAPKPPRLVTLEPASVQRLIAAEQSTEVLARVRIRVAAAKRDVRTTVNLALALDTSGSMEGEAIAAARQACHAMVDALSDGDRLAIVTFDSHAEVLLASTLLDGAERKRAHAAIDQIVARGTTSLGAGLALALQEARAFVSESNMTRVVLVGDGVPNDEANIVAMAQQAAGEKIAITALGLGIDYDETLMGRLAEAGGGKFHYVSEPLLVARVFEEEVLRMQRVAGRGASVRLAAGPGVEIREVVGFAMVPSGRDRLVAIGDLVEGEARELVVRLGVPARAAGATIELFDAEVSYEDVVVNGGAVKAETFLALKASDKPDEVRAGYDPELDRATAHASVAALILQAIATARSGSLEAANKLLDEAERVARERGRALSDEALAQKLGALKKLRASLPQLVPARVAAVAEPAGGLHAPYDGPGVLQAMPAPEAARIVREAHAAARDVLN